VQHDAADFAMCLCEALRADSDRADSEQASTVQQAILEVEDVSTQTTEDMIDVSTAEAMMAEAVQIIRECDAAFEAAVRTAHETARKILAKAIESCEEDLRKAIADREIAEGLAATAEKERLAAERKAGQFFTAAETAASLMAAADARTDREKAEKQKAEELAA